jgi:hypothetical protein
LLTRKRGQFSINSLKKMHFTVNADIRNKNLGLFQAMKLALLLNYAAHNEPSFSG